MDCEAFVLLLRQCWLSTAELAAHRNKLVCEILDSSWLLWSWASDDEILTDYCPTSNSYICAAVRRQCPNRTWASWCCWWNKKSEL